jgi:hypothetical protein
LTDLRAKITVRPMQQRRMVILMVEQTGYGTIRRVPVSVPYVEQLMDGKKYMEPGDVKPKECRDLRRLRQTPRPPTLKAMARLARRCDNAEQLGLELRKRYARKPSEREIAEIDAKIDRVLDAH